MRGKQYKMVKKQRLLIVASVLLTVLMLSGCGSDSSSDTPSFKFISDNDTGYDTSATEKEPEKAPQNTVNIKMVGDILLHEKVVSSGTKDDGTYDFNAIFSDLCSEIKSADVSIANQEVILGGAEIGISGYPCFNGPFEVGDALVNAGFDVVTHATNHALDKGKAGIVNCMNFWETEHPEIKYLGINKSAESQNEVYIRTENGIKIAFLNYTYGTNGITAPDDMPYCVNYLDENKVISDITYAEEHADFTVVIPHWGTEYIHSADQSQEYWADLFTKYGADLIIGAHPHVIEPVEWITSGNNKALVYYSLGNFVSCTAESGQGKCDRMLGAMADVTIEMTEGKAQIKEFNVIPLVTHIEDGFGGITVVKLNDYTEEMALRSYTNQIDSTFSLEYIKTLANDVFGELVK